MEKSYMNKKESLYLFNCMYPDFFEKERIKDLPKDMFFTEMILSLEEYHETAYSRELDDSISFGYYSGNLDELKEIVRKIAPHWSDKFNGENRIYCGYVNGKVVSFCIIENLGTYHVDGQQLRIGGPGCVGTQIEYRNQGIALTMINHVTQILKEEGYHFSYIHFTVVSTWYEKIGYSIFLKWNKDGPVID